MWWCWLTPRIPEFDTDIPHPQYGHELRLLLDTQARRMYGTVWSGWSPHDGKSA
jgi:hypothetical protein